MQIVDIHIFELTGTWQNPFTGPTSRQAQQLDIYPEFNSRDWSQAEANLPQEISALYIEILTDDGISGLFGPIEDEQAYIIQRFLKPLLIRRDPLATEMLYDLMIRLNRHGRSGLFMTGASAVDCALWDLKGKAWNQPVYRLLGGPTREAVRAYASLLGFSTEPEMAVQTALQYQQMGYTAQKWFFRYGPVDGASGMRKNLALAKALREALGPHYLLMFDAFMGWDLTYATEIGKALEPLHPFWLEEPLPPERVGAFRKLKQAVRVPLATGEHIYTRWQVNEFLQAKAIDFVQTDPDWTGGITELAKICALASAYEVPVVAHGHSLMAALHVAGSQPPITVPMVEYLVRFQPYKQHFHQTIYEPVNGSVRLPELPGLGIVLDENKIKKNEMRY